jgi:16S rRNA (cytidine1402-2'-O)-methyltransferase
LSLSGISTGRFCFEGFLPGGKKEKQAILEELKDESRTIILYVAPHHLVRTLVELKEALGNRRIALCRELTKKFEEVMTTTFWDALAYYESVKPRGEYVLVAEGKSLSEKHREEAGVWTNMTIEAHMEHYEGQGIDRKEAMKKVAKDRGMGKREIYRQLHGE